MNNSNEENYDEYKEQRGILKKNVIQAKELEWINFGRKMEEDSKNNQKLFYKVLKNPRKERENNINQIRDKSRIMINDEDKKMDRWR